MKADAVRAYRWLLRLFPRAFRARFGRDMADLFDDNWRAARRRGPLAAAALAAATITDTIAHAAAERRRGSHKRGRHMLQSLTHDIRFALRAFWRRPSIAAAALVTMTLGVGANTAIFAVVRPLLLTPPPFPSPDQVVIVDEVHADQPALHSVVNPANFDAWERQPGIFTLIAGHTAGGGTLTGAGDPVRLKLTRATPSLFDVFGVRSSLGRTFTETEAASGAHVIVLSDALWRSRFGADPSIVGRSVMLDGTARQVIGVMPAAFRVPYDVDAWVPLVLTPAMRQDLTTRFLQVIARLEPGVTPSQAASALTEVMRRFGAAHGKFNSNRAASVRTWQDAEVSGVRGGLWMLQAMALMVLAIAGANLANLLLAHTAGRTREFAIRSAIGASRRQLLRQLLIEGMVLSLAGGACGALLALTAVPWMAALAPAWLPRAAELHVGWADAAAAIALALLSGAVFSLVPALTAIGRGLSAGAATRTMTSGRPERVLRSGLIAAQVALSLALLGGASVLVRSFARLTAQPIGFVADHVLTAELNLPRIGYESEDRRRQLFVDLIRDVAAQPGVVSAAASNAVPFTWWEWMEQFPVVGHPDVPVVDTSYRVVSSRYFDTLDVPVVRGRAFESGDTTGAPLVAVANEAFAKHYAALGNIIGTTLRRDDSAGGPLVTIVGIVGDTRHRSFERPPQPELYFPLEQSAPMSMTLAIRTSGSPLDAAGAVGQALRRLDPSLPINEVRTLSSWVGDAVAERRFYLTLFAVFAGLALALAVVGIYGVMAYVMRLRTREIGIRIALGASARSVTSLATRQGLTPVALGAIVGLAGCLAGVRLLRDQLFQTPARDPLSIGVALGVLGIAAAAACWLPARRSSRIDPALVLRND